MSVWMSRNLKSDSESEYKLSYKPRRVIDREPYSLRRQPDGVKIGPQSSEEGDDAYSSAYSEEAPMAMTNETLSQIIQMLVADREKDRADRERATEERLRQQEKARQERLQQQQRYERREVESRQEAARERERQETFHRIMQERQATQTERIQKAADTTQYIATIPAVTEGQDSEEYITNWRSYYTKIMYQRRSGDKFCLPKSLQRQKQWLQNTLTMQLVRSRTSEMPCCGAKVLPALKLYLTCTVRRFPWIQPSQ